MTLPMNCLTARVRGNLTPESSWINGADNVYRSKITFIAWSPDDAGIQVRILEISGSTLC
jgi:hypothetical protein